MPRVDLEIRYARTWRDPTNAVRFAVECADCAMTRYQGRDDKGSDRQVLRHAIEAMQMYVRGENVSDTYLRAHSNNAYTIANREYIEINSDVASCVGYAAEAAYEANRGASTAVGVRASEAASCATLAGVPPRTVARTCAKWIAKDLGIDLPGGAPTDAAVAAVMAGALGVIADIVKGAS